VSEGTKREKDERPVRDERRGAKGEGTAGAKNAPLGGEVCGKAASSSGYAGIREADRRTPKKPGGA